jgi:hypothetical protein
MRKLGKGIEAVIGTAVVIIALVVALRVGCGRAYTSTSIASSDNPSSYGESVTFTSTVSATDSGLPTGTVTFSDGTVELEIASLSSGQATYTTSALSVGDHIITAVYSGDNNFTGSTSPAITQTVKLTSTTTILTSSRNPSLLGDSVIFTATVSPTTGTGTPTGTVIFSNYDWENKTWEQLGTGNITSGQVTYMTSTLSVGNDDIQAVYKGDSDFYSSSSSITQVVGYVLTRSGTTTYPLATVTVNGSQEVGAKGYPIILIENPNAVNPTWDQLLNFLRSDDTDRQTYVPDSFVCGDFAQMLQNHAEEAGWRCAWVAIELSEPSASHALNAFQTTDRGLVFIDDTGATAGEDHPNNMDKRVNVTVEQSYKPVSLFPESGWKSTYQSSGIVSQIDVIQW